LVENRAELTPAEKPATTASPPRCAYHHPLRGNHRHKAQLTWLIDPCQISPAVQLQNTRLVCDKHPQTIATAAVPDGTTGPCAPLPHQTPRQGSGGEVRTAARRIAHSSAVKVANHNLGAMLMIAGVERGDTEALVECWADSAAALVSDPFFDACHGVGLKSGKAGVVRGTSVW